MKHVRRENPGFLPFCPLQTISYTAVGFTFLKQISEHPDTIPTSLQFRNFHCTYPPTLIAYMATAPVHLGLHFLL